MKVICSYCRETIEEDQAAAESNISHGMCSECYEHFKPQWEGLSLGHYLDRFHAPILVVDENLRLLAANQVMADLLGRPERELKGLLGGEVAECIYARLEEGCGKTVHCTACTIRNSVTHTFNTGETLDQVPCYVEQDTGTKLFRLTTVKLNESIQMILEPVPEEENPTPSE